MRRHADAFRKARSRRGFFGRGDARSPRAQPRTDRGFRQRGGPLAQLHLRREGDGASRRRGRAGEAYRTSKAELAKDCQRIAYAVASFFSLANGLRSKPGLHVFGEAAVAGETGKAPAFEICALKLEHKRIGEGLERIASGLRR